MAVRWWRNGDHPDDYTKSIHDLDGTTYTPEDRRERGWEGDVVRFYRDPYVDGREVCPHCGNTMHHHGWIDSGGAGQIVCPGDWIITGENGGYRRQPASLETAVGEAMGAASACWDNLAGAGVFESEKARALTAELLARLRAELAPRDRLAPGERTTDGGMTGVVRRCPQCSGDGLLFHPDEQPDAGQAEVSEL